MPLEKRAYWDSLNIFRSFENALITVGVPLLLWIFFIAYRCLYIFSIELCGPLEALQILFSSPQDILFWALLFLAFLMLSFFYMLKKETVNDFIFRWRWPIGGIVLTLLVIFEISGSSLSMWGEVLPKGTSEGLLLGLPRGIRSDEWATNLPMTFAQFNDTSGYLPYYGEVFRATSTDMFLVSGQPVMDIAILFRPLNWGYLLFGLARGLSFAWSCKLVGLFLLTFELGMVLLQKSKSLSLALALLIAFSPVVSWWGSGEMILYAEALFLLFLIFFKVEQRWKKTLIAIVFFILLGAYALLCYPAWQIPMAILFLSMGIAHLVRIRKSLHFSVKRDLFCVVPGVLVFTLGMLYVLSMSSETLHLTASTSYPGQRTSYGGGAFEALFKYPLTLFTPLSYEGLSAERADSISMFFDFFPLGLILGCYVLFIQKKRDPVLIVLLILELLLLLYCVVGFPEWLARITLMSFTISERAVVIASLANLLLLLYSISLLQGIKHRKIAVCLAVAYACVMASAAWLFESEYISVLKTAIIVMVVFIAVVAFLNMNTRWILICSLAIALFSGALVNPIQAGISPIQNNELIQQIRRIKDTSNAKWISATGWVENITALGGARTLNTTQFYPNFELWRILDPDGSEMETYNRFAHLRATIDDIPEASITLQAVDAIAVKIPVRQLQQLEVGYILSMKELDSLNGNSHGVHFNLKNKYQYSEHQNMQYENLFLYEIEYSQ